MSRYTSFHNEVAIYSQASTRLVVHTKKNPTNAALNPSWCFEVPDPMTSGRNSPDHFHCEGGGTERVNETNTGNPSSSMGGFHGVNRGDQ